MARLEERAPVKLDRTTFGIVLFALVIGAFGYAETSPTPFDTSKIDFSKISEEDIQATERHRDALRDYSFLYFRASD